MPSALNNKTIYPLYIQINNLKGKLTLRQTSTIIEQTPNSVSQCVISLTWSTTLIIASIKESLLPLRPRSVPNWDVAIIIAAALLNPEITGMLTNSKRNPKWSSPISRITQPDMKHMNTWKRDHTNCTSFKEIVVEFVL